jgi:hypothetical protein
MEQSEKNIYYNDLEMDQVLEANLKMSLQGNYSQVYQNLCVAVENRFDTGLIRWRRGESPVFNFIEALAHAQSAKKLLTDREICNENILGYADIWIVIFYCSYFTDRPIILPKADIIKLVYNADRPADVELESMIVQAILGKEWRTRYLACLDKLSIKRRQALAAKSYKTYLALLDRLHDLSLTDDLVREAEQNYNRRSKDPFYEGGPTYMVDFTLAAILKFIDWPGESIHKWRWQA